MATSEECLKDVFQDEIINAISNFDEFLRFARSGLGLCLNELDIQHIVEDKDSSEDRKMAMLEMWSQNYGKDATVQTIRDIVKSYKTSRELFQLHSSSFLDAQFSGESSTGSGTPDTTHHPPNNDEPTTSSLGTMQPPAVFPKEAVGSTTQKQKLSGDQNDRAVSFEGNFKVNLKEKNVTRTFDIPIRSTVSGKFPNNGSTSTPSQTDSDQAVSMQGNIKVHLQEGQSIETYDFPVGSTFKSQFQNNESTSTPSGTDESFKEGVLINGTDITYFPRKPLRRGSNVFEAVRIGVTKEKIVVKFIPNFIEKNEKEVKHLIHAGDSEYVVKYLQSGFCEYHSDKAIFIAMERCETKTLADKIKEDNLSYEERKEYVHCIAKGLLHLKNKGIMHRDMKPHNILFRNGKPVISDFGLSKHLQQGKSNTQQSGVDTGTHGWRAQETSVMGNKTCHKTDVFASGLLYHFVLTDGSHAYPGKKEIHRQTHIDDDEDETKCNLQELNKTPDGVFAFDLIGSMLRRDPSNRPSIEEVLKHIFFFESEKKLEFMTFADNLLKNGYAVGSFGEEVKNEMKDWKEKLVLTNQEKKTMEENFLEENVSVEVDANVMKKKAEKYKDSVTEVIRLIRNRDIHSTEDKIEKGIFLTKSQFFKFFFDRFPHLIIYVFNRIKHEYWKPR